MPQKVGSSSTDNLTLQSYVKKCGRWAKFLWPSQNGMLNFKFNVFLACIMFLLVWSSFCRKNYKSFDFGKSKILSFRAKIIHYLNLPFDGTESMDEIHSLDHRMI